MNNLPKNFPFYSIFNQFLQDYTNCNSYWYVPKVRSLNDENAKIIKNIVKILAIEFTDRVWDSDTQDELLELLIKKGILEPYTTDGTLQDRTALSRIWKKLLETLGLAWVHEDRVLVVTEAGLKLVDSHDPRPIIEQQIAKIQYPNPSLTGNYSEEFKGLIPHVFILQLLIKCEYKISLNEYNLFVNLAQKQDDLNKIARYIIQWRDLSEQDQVILEEITLTVPMASDPLSTRHDRIRQSSPYQVSFYTYPNYLFLDDSHIKCVDALRYCQ